jgi:hypothetical protein
MKKILAIIAILTICCSLCSCGTPTSQLNSENTLIAHRVIVKVDGYLSGDFDADMVRAYVDNSRQLITTESNNTTQLTLDVKLLGLSTYLLLDDPGKVQSIRDELSKMIGEK